MTFNVQLLPTVPLTSSPGNEAKERALKVVQEILAIEPREQPNVIAFNEVFSEDGRDVLYNELKTLYPHVIQKLDDCFIGQDSGLMIFSKHHFLNLAINNQNHYFESYTSSDDSDKLACKGFAIVQIETNLGVLTLTFTHTQAYYKSENEYAPTRQQQLKQLGEGIAKVIGLPSAKNYYWNNVVVAGDLNIRGDKGATSTEWKETFETGTTVFTTKLCDTWRTYMKSPSASLELDEGFTNNNLEAGENGALPIGLLSRLDYICTRNTQRGRNERRSRRLVTQHNQIRIRNASDHWSLEANIHHELAHNTPNKASVWSDSFEVQGINAFNILIDEVGVYHWIYVKEPSTYSFFKSDNIEIAIYLEEDLSNEYAFYDKNSINKFPEPVLSAAKELNLNDEEVVQYALSKPFFVRVRAAKSNQNFVGSPKIGILKHTGESPITAIFLKPWDNYTNPRLPLNQANGQNDHCWFRAMIHRALSGDVHLSNFYLQNTDSVDAKFTLLDASLNKIDIKPSNSTLTQIDYQSKGDETVFLLLQRADFGHVNFEVKWESELTYLREIPNLRPMVLRCIDETGSDWAGADEIRLKLFADNMPNPFLEVYWDDADANEILKLAGITPPIAFIKKIRVWINEEDNIIEGSSNEIEIPSLTPSETSKKEIIKSITVQTGEYQFECSFDRYIQ